jgi:hypothetical protein
MGNSKLETKVRHLQSLVNGLFDGLDPCLQGKEEGIVRLIETLIGELKEEFSKITLFCTNCGAEFTLKESGICIRGYDNSPTHFCPCCGWLEVTTPERLEEDPEYKGELKRRFEEGDHRGYGYPKDIIRQPSKAWRQIHSKLKKNWGNS